MKKTHASEKFMTSAFNEVHLKEIAKDAQISEASPEAGLICLDGDLGQVAAVMEPDMQKKLQDMYLSVVKHEESCLQH